MQSITPIPGACGSVIYRLVATALIGSMEKSST
jgi:hypothetical protein